MPRNSRTLGGPASPPTSRNDRVVKDAKIARIIGVEPALSDEASFTYPSFESELPDAKIEKPTARRRGHR